MLSIDTSVLFTAVVEPGEGPVTAFVRAQADRSDVVVSELALVELYALLRDPAVVARPLTPGDAVRTVDRFRRHPRWRTIDHDQAVMADVWRAAGASGFARRRIFDARLALGLLRHGVTEIATRDPEDFQGFGFARVFDPSAV